eukprot:TRINITY_DN3644_c0_g1_i1.p1 TRINITY_DN3644_c0_g1~~TRINITY_DN3644_c0_g1_i1.p1  ORF type:complete len:217 (+),score=71.34 TRINITY_DN3644_c0_g1_i1:266-916(+)
MDSTLIQQEVIDEMARYANVYEDVQKVTERAMRGEMDFNQSLKLRVGLLKGHHRDELFQKVISNLKYTEGDEHLFQVLKKMGIRTAVLSGGFTEIVQHAQKELGLDHAFGNDLVVDAHGHLTGEIREPILNAQRKADLLTEIAETHGIETQEIIAVGDGANDLLMLARAYLGVAFNAKPKVQQSANFWINQPSIANLLYLLGISDDDADAILSDSK